MPQDGQRTRIAVLIDADNASHRHADALFAEIAKLGEAVVRRIYGDFTTPGLKGWNDRMSRHALMPIQTIAYTKGKNASDIALVLDASDLMHSKLYDAFCIVSSDSDFTRLAQRLRESGAEVYGFGESKTPEAFRQSCRRFFLVENLARGTVVEGEGDMPEPTLPLPLVPTQILPARDAYPIIAKAYNRHVADTADGMVSIRLLQRTIANIAADFDARTYGQERLGDLAVATGMFELSQKQEGGWWIKLKANRGQGKPAASKPIGMPPPVRPSAPTREAPRTTAAPTATAAATPRKQAVRKTPVRKPSATSETAVADTKPRTRKRHRAS